MSGAKSIFISFDTVRDVLYFSAQFIHIDETITTLCDNLSYDEQTTKKILLNIALTNKAKNWCSKDTDLQAKTAGLIFYMYKETEEKIKERLQQFCERCTEDTQNNLMSEGEYKYRVDMLMMLNKVFEYYGDVEYDKQPTGEWYVEDNITLLKLRYNLI
jgi:hypothetical protein